MKQVILMSIRPEWVAKIANGEKTIEVRKHALKEGDEVHIYCTKGKPYLYEYDGFHLTSTRSWSELHDNGDREWFYIEEVGELNGKVVAKFIVGKVQTIPYLVIEDNYGNVDGEEFLLEKGGEGYDVCENDLKPICISYDKLLAYGKKKPLYALSITQLEIFDRPRELGEYKKLTESYDLGATGGFMKAVPITKAPQSYMHAWVEE